MSEKRFSIKSFVMLIGIFFINTGVQASSKNMIVVPESDRQSAPAFSTSKLDSSPVTLEDYKGKVVLLHFWATWCAPCIEEMLHMESLWKKYQDKGLIVVAVTVQEKPEGQIKAFSEKMGLSFPILLDIKGEISALYDLAAMPSSYLISRDGKVVARIKGTGDWSDSEIKQLIESLLI